MTFPPSLLLELKLPPENEMPPYPILVVLQLIGTDIAAKGWLVVFCKRRGCNVEFYNWLNKSFIVPNVMKLRSAYDLSDDDIAWFQLDGEPKQIECYESESMQQHMTESDIVCGKPAASTTSVT